MTDQALADAVAAEDARQALIAQLLHQLQADPTNVDVLSQLADAYLAGQTAADQQRGAAALLLLLSNDPQNASAYRRLITAYMNAGDWTDARSAVDAYADVRRCERAGHPLLPGAARAAGR